MRLTIPMICGILLASATRAQSPFQCAVQSAAIPQVRIEGVTELVSDIVLDCTGGTPAPFGQTVPVVNVSLTLNVPVSSRLLNPAGMSDAILLIDEPSGAGSFVVCQTEGTTAVNNAAFSVTGCPLLGTGTGVSYAAPLPNVFTGVVSGNSIAWNAVPLDPTTAPMRVVRLTNVRANTAALPPGATTIQATVAITTPSGDPISVANSTLTVANPQSSLTYNTLPATILNTAGNLTAAGGGPAVVTFIVNERFPNAWKALDGSLSSPTVTGVAAASQVGLNPNSESGLVIFSPPPAGTLGVANNPTMFEVNLDLPAGMTATFPNTVEITQNGAPAGSISWSWNGTQQPGATTAVTIPSDGLYLFGSVVQSGIATAPRQFVMPVTLSGPYPVPNLPLLLVPGFAGYPLGPTATSLLAKSLESAGIPVFDSALPNGPQLPNTPIVATIISPATLALPGPLQYQATDGFNQLVSVGVSPPVQINVPQTVITSVYSTGEPVTGLTLLSDPGAPWLTASLLGNTTPALISVSVDPTVPRTNNLATLTVGAAGHTPLAMPFTFNTTSPPWFTKWGFSSTASYVGNVVAPGEQFIIFGYNFGPPTIAGPELGADGSAVTMLANTQVLFDNRPAPLYYVVNTPTFSLITGFAPFEINGQGETQVQVRSNNQGFPVTVTVLDAAPGLYTAASTGTGQAAILNADGSVNSGQKPASVGDIVAVYGTGGGQTIPAGRNGAITGSGAPVAVFQLPVTVFVDGAPISNVPYAGPAPGLVEGIFQVNFQIPPSARHNANLPVMIQIGDKLTQPGVTIAVK
jgi:uncharacterized protein (TIGR03437 family)